VCWRRRRWNCARSLASRLGGNPRAPWPILLRELWLEDIGDGRHDNSLLVAASVISSTPLVARLFPRAWLSPANCIDIVTLVENSQFSSQFCSAMSALRRLVARSVRIMPLASGRRPRLRLPTRQRLSGEPDRQASAISQGCIIFAPVRNSMTLGGKCGVCLSNEAHMGISESRGENQ
jgi:hypothetical protein